MRFIKVNRRSLAIVAAILLGIAALLYLGGLVGQINAGYREWLAADGMAGGVRMRTVNWQLLYCCAYAFTAAGRIGVLFILALTALTLLVLKLYGKFDGRDYDERNFTRSRSGVYGTAGWMSEKEMKEVLELAGPAAVKGTILGQYKKSLVCLPHDAQLNQHIAIFGATGTRKSRGIIRPYLFQSIKRGESVIVTDPKKELYTDTAELFRANGYQVKVFNLVDPAHGDSWNCMADLNGDTLMAQVLTDVIITNTSGEKPDHFWDNGEGNLLKSLVLYVDQDPAREAADKNLPAVYQLLTQNNERELTAMFDRLPLAHPAKASYNLFSQASDTVRTGIVLGLGTRLQVLQNEAVRQITASSDIDLTAPGQKKCAYFVIISDQERALDFLSSLFFSFLFIKLVRFADSTPELRCPIPVNIVLDEANNIGTIPDFSRRLSTIRSRSLQVVMAMQNMAQLQNRYPYNLWAELIGNFDTQLMLGCTDELTAEYCSARSGDMTIEVNSTMTVRRTIAVAQLIPQYRHTEGQGRRRLMTPDEVLRLPNDELLIMIRGQKLLRADKFDYTDHPMARHIRQASLVDYASQRRQAPPSQTDIAERQKPVNNPASASSGRTKESPSQTETATTNKTAKTQIRPPATKKKSRFPQTGTEGVASRSEGAPTPEKSCGEAPLSQTESKDGIALYNTGITPPEDF